MTRASIGRSRRSELWIVVGALLLMAPLRQATSAAQAAAEQEFRGGVAVYLDPMDLAPIVRLKASVPNSLIHICVQQPQQVERLRSGLQELDLRGEVSVSHYDGQTIPFVSLILFG